MGGGADEVTTAAVVSASTASTGATAAACGGPSLSSLYLRIPYSPPLPSDTPTMVASASITAIRAQPPVDRPAGQKIWRRSGRAG